MSAVTEFVGTHVVPQASAWDQTGVIPANVLTRVAQAGYFALPALPVLGEWHEAFGFGCSSLKSILTVHAMVSSALDRWGSEAQRHLLPQLARGEVKAAFALTEPEVGSDAAGVQCAARKVAGGLRINGSKKWITFGQHADVFLVLVRLDGQHTAVLVPRDAPGLRVRPAEPLTGLRASALAELTFEECAVPESAIVGRPGFGLSHVFGAALDLGRFIVAWGCVGMMRACREDSVRYVAERRQFGAPLAEHQLVRRMVAGIIARHEAAHALCLRAREGEAIRQTIIAKYFAANAVGECASDAVQLQGASGLREASLVSRLWRDAKVMSLIEGSRELLEVVIGA